MSSIRITPSGVDESQFATAAQGAKADSAVQPDGTALNDGVITNEKFADGAITIVQPEEPTGDIPVGTLWLDSDSNPEPLPQLLPRRVSFTAVAPPSASSGHDTLIYTSGAIFLAYRQSNTQNAYIEYEILLDSGTYSLQLLHEGHTISAIVSLTLDGVSIGSVDFYRSSYSPNALSTITGIAVTAGHHTLRLTTATKNASSSAYYMRLQHVGLVRTGA